MGEHIYRFNIEELKVLRLKFSNNSIREFPLATALSYDEVLPPDAEKHLRGLSQAIQYFSRKDSDLGIEFVLNVRDSN